jgi:hypothetical protein
MNAYNRAMKRAALGGMVLCALGFGTAGAAGLPKEGSYNFTACWSGVASRIDYSKEYSANSVEFTGTTRSDPAGGLFDRSTFRCLGTSASLAGKTSAIYVCEAVDPDGDRRLIYFSSEGDKVVRENVTGTGKYEGMVASGTVQPLPPFPSIKPGTIQSCNQQAGTYKLK